MKIQINESSENKLKIKFYSFGIYIYIGNKVISIWFNH